MSGSGWLCLWMTVLLMTPVVIVQEDRAKDLDMGHAQVQSGVFPRESGGDTEAVTEFQRRLRQYDVERRRLDASLPTQARSSNPAVMIAIVEAHKAALRSARLSAKQGDLFFPGIAGLFRHRIRDSLHGMKPKDFLAMITEEDAPPMALPYVNGSYPDGGALTTMPPRLLTILPRLPAGLEYRFIDDDLILWDPHAGLIIDFIPHALFLSGES
jgi:hypothetical protein